LAQIVTAMYVICGRASCVRRAISIDELYWRILAMRENRLSKGVRVAVGCDRHEKDGAMIWGLIPLAIKLSSNDTAGELLVFQHANMGKGGPPRHVHHAQDEWFYVVAGEFAAEVGDEKFTLRPGDSLFAPRQVPHAWAHVCDKPGTLITTVTPAGTFEKFIRETTLHPTLPSPEDIARAFAAHNMTVVGPPLKVD
jgi:mannose-6-phosphate isomerase-like protein (cupin superfamily)